MKLDPQILFFLKDLSNNNNKQWFEQHRNEYDSAKNSFLGFIDEVVKNLQKIEPRIVNEKPHVKTFRINRDIRFSKDKTPYKTNFGATFNYKGMSSGYPGYYLHIELDNSAIAGGMHEMETSTLNKVRDLIAAKYLELESILDEKEFKKFFANFGSEELALKTIPRGYDKDHPAKEFLRQKSFTVWHTLPDKELTAEGATDTIREGFKQMKKLNDFLEKWITL